MVLLPWEWPRRSFRVLYGSTLNGITYWIQHGDFSGEDFPRVDLATAIRVFREHDWSDELRREDARALAGEENCPAGIGFVADGRLLHICPTNEDHALVHYHFTRERRVLSLFSRKVETVRSALRFPLTRVPETLERFYQEDHDWLSQHVR